MPCKQIFPYNPLIAGKTWRNPRRIRLHPIAGCVVSAVRASGMATAREDCRVLAVHLFGEHDFVGGLQMGKVLDDLVITPNTLGGRQVECTSVFLHASLMTEPLHRRKSAPEAVFQSETAKRQVRPAFYLFAVRRAKVSYRRSSPRALGPLRGCLRAFTAHDASVCSPRLGHPSDTQTLRTITSPAPTPPAHPICLLASNALLSHNRQSTTPAARSGRAPSGGRQPI